MNNRIELIGTLLMAEDGIDSQYIANEIDRDTWAKSLQEIDDKLSVLGVRLAHRPWESPQPGQRF